MDRTTAKNEPTSLFDSFCSVAAEFWSQATCFPPPSQPVVSTIAPGSSRFAAGVQSCGRRRVELREWESADDSSSTESTPPRSPAKRLAASVLSCGLRRVHLESWESKDDSRVNDETDDDMA